MPEPKGKGEVLSVGAKTYLKKIAKEIILGYRTELDVKYIKKGNECEQASIDLLNTVLFKNYVKNTVRVNTDFMSGECDILRPDYIRDIKTSWSTETFPLLCEDAEDKDYEYQGRAYMHLYDRPVFYLDYCMVTTPPELCKYEQQEIHNVDHIDPRIRVTTVRYERDLEIEKKMLEKCKAAQIYVEEIKLRIIEEKNI